MRVECEKAAESAGGDALWELLGDRSLATLHLVRAYRERTLHAAYSGLLPPQPHHSSGKPIRSRQLPHSLQQPSLKICCTCCLQLAPAIPINQSI